MIRETKVINFDASEERLLRRAARLLDNSEYIDALPYLRRAEAQKPEDVELKLNLAEAFTEMHLFDESNEILLNLERRYGRLPADCYFIYACNFLGLDDLPRSRQNFEHYLSVDPGGEYALKSRGYLEMIDEELQEYEEYEESGVFLADDMAAQGQELLDSNCPAEAIRKLEEALAVDPMLLYARNNLSMAYFFTGDTKSAIRVAEEVLREEDTNVHANCNLALYYESMGNRAKAVYYTHRAMAGELDPESLDKAMHVMSLFKDDESIYRRLKSYIFDHPFDVRALFYLAMASANTSREKEANKYLTDVLKVDPDNCAAAYYKLNLGRHKGRFIYDYQVPPEEGARRINLLNELIKLPAQELAARWKDRETRLLFKWGLELSDPYIKESVAEAVAAVGDDAATDMLSHFLLDRRQPEEVKGAVFSLLKDMGASGVFFAYIHGHLIEARIGIFDTALEMPKAYREVLSLLIDNMGRRYNPRITDCALEAWRDYALTMEGNYRRINSPRLWAAAMETMTTLAAGVAVDKEDIERRYGVKSRGMMERVREIQAVLGWDTDELCKS